MVRDSLGDRMKAYYEEIPKIKLMRRTPVIIRIDGKAFHTFTRGMQKPFDAILIKTMQETTKYLCENIQGCVLGYTQSDEISLVLIDYQKLETSAWFDYEVQKMCSIAASMATMAFNKYFTSHIHMIMTHLHCMNPEDEWFDKQILKENYGFTDEDFESDSEFFEKRLERYQKVIGSAMFDARCFNIPKEEVTNYIYWRQLDATRNSIQSVGQANFSHKELHCKTCNDIQDMLMTQKGINWNNFPAYLKRGTAVFKNGITVKRTNKMEEITLHNPELCSRDWVIDLDMPQLKGENRDYVERLIKVWQEQ